MELAEERRSGLEIDLATKIDFSSQRPLGRQFDISWLKSDLQRPRSVLLARLGAGRPSSWTAK